VFRTMAHAVDSEQSGITYSQHHTARPLLTSDEIRTLPSHVQLLFLAGRRPIVAHKLRYYSDGEFKGTFDIAS
jgi:type IV secretion system protein VirD4